MVKRETIGNNPLDDLIREQKPSDQKEITKNRKKRITVQIPEEIIERVKNATYWTPGLTLSHLVEKALHNEVSKMEEIRGSSFQKRSEELKTGRPIK